VAIHEEVVEVYGTLDPAVVARIVIGCTDTPSANVSSWVLLEETFPTQVWMGCMNHELGLMFNEWMRKVTAITQLYLRTKRLTIWIRNHGDLLIMFEKEVQLHWPNDKRMWTIHPYMPGDTRMATMYKLIHRAVKLKAILQSLVTGPAYVRAAQKAISQYNTQAKPERRIPANPDGTFPDAIAIQVLDAAYWQDCGSYLQAAKSSMYLLRLVDTCTPCLGKVYYSSALINKHLAILARSSSMAQEMLDVFKRRWARWHKPIHTLAYALDPSYQSHSLTHAEKLDCKKVLGRLRPGKVPTLLIQLNAFKADSGSFTNEEWEAVDHHHAYQWWDTFGDIFPELQSVAVDILSKCASASACEFNWSQVSRVERKGRASLKPATTNKSINVAASYQLEKSILSRGVCTNLPTLDAVICEVVDNDEDEAPLPNVVDLEESVAGVSVPGIADNNDDDELEDATELAALAARLNLAESALYADWSDRASLLPGVE
jgi:hypothetical protein